MFEVYLNDRRDLLVIEKGSRVPPIAVSGKWRKRKTKVVRVSDEIRSAVQMQGYYLRKVSDQKSRGPMQGELAAMRNFYSITTKPSRDHRAVRGE